MKLNHNNKGLGTEDAAAHFLQQQGLTLLTRNYSCRYGEVDLIMREHDTLVFVEVRLRSNLRFSSAADSIHHFKQQKLIRAAQYYLQSQPGHPPCRFDAVLFSHPDQVTPDWIRNAIEA